MDFSLKKYLELLTVLQTAGYSFQTYGFFCIRTAPYVKGMDDRFCILRHDVDLRPRNSLATAQIEAELGLNTSYYFRAVPESWDEEIICKIASLGHEIGYHYESLTTCKGDVDKAYDDFCLNLERLRKIVPVSTICMHGSPRSPYDSKDIWKKYDYKVLGIVGEPYLDTDFSQIFYLTDTGRRWDGAKVSVRDKIPVYQDEWVRKGWTFHSTDDIIRAVQRGILPERLMMTTHPQRWTDNMIDWGREILLQHAKNVIKRLMTH